MRRSTVLSLSLQKEFPAKGNKGKRRLHKHPVKERENQNFASNMHCNFFYKQTERGFNLIA
jgi:hypothetical protein